MDAISGVLVQVEIPLDYYYLGDQKAPGSETKLSSSQRLLLILSTKCIFDKRAWEMKKRAPFVVLYTPPTYYVHIIHSVWKFLLVSLWANVDFETFADAFSLLENSSKFLLILFVL